jgi:hypothetical protein
VHFCVLEFFLQLSARERLFVSFQR